MVRERNGGGILVNALLERQGERERERERLAERDKNNFDQRFIVQWIT